MAMTVLAAMTEFSGADFKSRINYLIVKAAVNILSESPATPLHSQRADLAKKILNHTDQYISPFARVTITNLDLTTIDSLASVLDSDLQNAVNGIYNDFL